VSSTAKRRRILVVVGVVVLLLILIGLCSHRRGANQAAAAGRSGGRGGAGGPVPVAVATVQQQDVPVYLRGLGNVAAYYTVNVRTRIDGQLQAVNFREGQNVRAGEELALIDPRPSETALMQAQAKQFQDTATLENARRDLVRLNDLYKAGIVPQQQYDAQKAAATSAEGLVRSDEAAVATAKLNVAYCHIVSPISGKVGLRNVDPGNMVHAADPNPLMTITQIEPIAVVFTLPEDNLVQVQQHMHSPPLVVEAWSRDDTQQISTGRLETIDNQIDPNTGTFKLKGVFDNRDGALYPNQFINARLEVDTMRGALVIPAAAVQHGAQGTYVYVVKPDKSVESRPITVALTQGTTAVIANGLQPGETVVTDGQDKLQPGSKVQIAGPRSADVPSARRKKK
jgi:multidrug efflux system membrane fusion protein